MAVKNKETIKRPVKSTNDEDGNHYLHDKYGMNLATIDNGLPNENAEIAEILEDAINRLPKLEQNIRNALDCLKNSRIQNNLTGLSMAGADYLKSAIIWLEKDIDK